MKATLEMHDKQKKTKKQHIVFTKNHIHRCILSLKLSVCEQNCGNIKPFDCSSVRLGPHLQITPNPADSPHLISQIPNADRQKANSHGEEREKASKNKFPDKTKQCFKPAFNDG